MQRIINKLYHYKKNPKLLGIAILSHLAPIIPDKQYLKWMFRLEMGHKLNLKNPKTFCEKIQWLKLYNRKPEYTQMVDKFAVKEYAANIIGNEYIIPTLGVWDRFEDIDFDKLPNQFVLKTTHGGGNTGVVICRDKSKLDRNVARKRLNKSLQISLYDQLREWPYKDVERRIIAEEYLGCIGNTDLIDYKFYCFNGQPLYCQVIKDRNSKETIDFFDQEWNHQVFYGLNLYGRNPKAIQSSYPIDRPINYDKMVEVASKLSHNIPFARVDLYNIGGKIYFGEITFFPASGYGMFTPSEWDYKLGNLIKLPNLDL